MDVDASPLGSGTQKLFGWHDQDKDVISKLPEDILVRILALLSTQDAIKTSILSKRWKYLWVSLRHFSFSDFSLRSMRTQNHDKFLELEASFLNSIDKALFLRNDSCLGNLDLWLKSSHVGASQLHSWVSAAVKRKVQTLMLALPDKGDLVLPNSLFTSTFLTHLWLHTHCTLKVPSFICFSGLKSLILRGVVFQQDNQSAEQLFSGFPVLENLILFHCHWENIKEMTIEIPTLRVLTLTDNSLEDHFLGGKIIISAVNLETLDVSSSLAVEFSPCNLLSLKYARIDINNLNGGQEPGPHIVKLLSGLHKVRSLHVSSATLKSLLFAENLEGCLPTFYNLTSLYNFVERPPVQADYTSGMLVYILQKSPNLETLDLPRGFGPAAQDLLFETVPHCFQSSLKSFTIFNFDGHEGDLCLLKYVRENAPFLKWLTMGCSPGLSKDLEKQAKIAKQLQQLPRSSESCLIEFIPYRSSLTW